MGTKEIQAAIGKMEVLSNHIVCENISLLRAWEYDVMSFSKSGILNEFEVKISRSDFKADFKKGKMNFYSEVGLVEKWTPNYFYYVCPEGLISENEIPDFAGLLYAKDGKLFTIKPARKLHGFKHDRERIVKKVIRIYSERAFLGMCRMTYENKISKEKFDRYESQRDKELIADQQSYISALQSEVERLKGAKDDETKGYWFMDEHGHEVTVLGVAGDWCVVSKTEKRKPYLLPLEFVKAIRQESNHEK